ncbi:MAG: site-specific integrase, partial [Thermoplasmata archaeon]
MRARSAISADVWLRNLGLYCELNNITPEIIIENAKNGKLKNEFMDFVRKMESEGKAGSYIVKFKYTLRSWLIFNDIDYKMNVNIANEGENPMTMNERIPTKDELARMLRESTKRGRVAIALMAFSGLRPESLGNYEGTDGLLIGDLVDFNLKSIEFEKIPAIIVVRSRLSKARNQYFTFIGKEGCDLIKEYVKERIEKGEKLSENSPVLQINDGIFKNHNFMRTLLVSRDIREGINKAGVKMRPYVLRAYFATALDIAESKGLISHPWRMFMMGHKGDIEARYSTNKRLPPDMIEEMRESYKKCTKYLETRNSEPSENDAKLYLQQQLLLAVGYKQEEIDKIDLTSMSNEDFQKLLRDKVTGAMTNNGNKQK